MDRLRERGTVNVTDRVMQMAMLCKLEGWTRERFGRELRERYPNGPNPGGDGWDKWEPEIDEVYRSAMEHD